MGETNRTLVFQGVSKRFSRGRSGVDALVDVSFDLSGGQIVGLLGENGAGKTTLLRVVAGLVEADRGDVRVLGRSVREQRAEIQRRIGWMGSDERTFYPRLSGRENLRLFGVLSGLDRPRCDARVAELAKVLALEAVLERPFQTCSAGQRRRLAIARALLHEPDVLLLDEPTRSLDGPSRASLATLLREYVAHGDRLVVVAGHEEGELDGLLDRTVVLRAGRVESAGSAGNGRPEAAPPARAKPSAFASVLALARRDRLLFSSYRSQIALRGGLFAAWLLVLYYVSALVDTSSPKVAKFLSGDYFTFALLGMVFLRITQVSLVQMASALREEQLQGTVEPLFVTGQPPIRIVLGGLAWPLASEVAGLAIVFGFGAAVLGVHLPKANLPALLLASLATILVNTVWGVISAAFVMAFKRGDPVALLGNLITVALSGAFFPVEMIPKGLRPVSDVLPLRWGLEAVRAAARGSSVASPEFGRALAGLGLVAVVLAPLAAFLFGASIRRARRDGSLGHS